MHPLSDETLVAYLNGRPDPLVDEHLRACPDCARRGRALADWGEALAEAMGEGRKARAFPWRWGVAAAVLLALGGAWLLREPKGPASPPVSRPEEARVVASGEGLEILASPGTRIERDAAGTWILSSGACLIHASTPVALSAGGLGLRGTGEILLSAPARGRSALLLREAWGEEEAIRIAMLSGRMEVSSGARRESLIPGELLQVGPGGWIRKTLSSSERSAFRRRVLGERASPAGSLQKRGNRTSWVLPPPAASYHVSVRMRVRGTRAQAGLNLDVDGHPVFWGAPLEDGAWHDLAATVSPLWVSLILDGRTLERFPRKAVRPNPAAEISGAGPVAWEGELEVEDFELGGLR